MKLEVTRLSIILVMCFSYFGTKSQESSRNIVACESLLKEENQSKLAEHFKDWDSTVFANIGRQWTKDNGLKGVGFNDGKIFTLEVFFKKEIDRDPYWAIDISSTQKKQVKSETECNKFLTLNIDTLFTLSNDSLNLKTQNSVYEEISHQPYYILAKSKNGTFQFKFSYNAEYYQSIAPTKERKSYLKNLKQLIEML